MANNSGEFMKGVFVGGLFGSLAALLFAPQSGKETREEISKRSDEVLSKSRDEYERALEKAKDSYERAIKQLHTLEDSIKESVNEVEGNIKDVTEKGKSAVKEKKNHLNEAVKAGVETYKEEKAKSKKS